MSIYIYFGQRIVEYTRGHSILKQEDIFDVTIIGAGPAGLYASFYSGLRDLKTKIIEFQPYLGGKINVYKEKMLWDVGGHAPAFGNEMIENLSKQAQMFSPEIVLGEKVTSIEKDHEDNFKLQTNEGNIHYSKTVIMASGSGILKPQRLKISGAEKYELSNLNYTVPSLSYFKDKVVLISGAGNSAIDWANELEPIAKGVYLICRKDCLSCHEASANQLFDSSAMCFFDTSIHQLIASRDHKRIEEVELVNKIDGQRFKVPIDEVLINHGFERDVSLLENCALQVETEEHRVIGNAFGESTMLGLYAIGDLLAYEGKLNLIAGAFQDAANAVNKAKLLIEPEAKFSAGVSSHNDKFIKKNQEIKEQFFKKNPDVAVEPKRDIKVK